MAIDAYLQIDGIKGESQDDAHKEWIEVTGVPASTGGKHTAERADQLG